MQGRRVVNKGLILLKTNFAMKNYAYGISYVDDDRKQKCNNLRMNPSFSLNSIVVEASVDSEYC